MSIQPRYLTFPAVAPLASQWAIWECRLLITTSVVLTRACSARRAGHIFLPWSLASPTTAGQCEKGRYHVRLQRSLGGGIVNYRRPQGAQQPAAIHDIQAGSPLTARALAAERLTETPSAGGNSCCIRFTNRYLTRHCLDS